MPLTQKWDQRRIAAACGRCTTAGAVLHLPKNKKMPSMPTRGYRKGVSDRKVPVSRSLRTHISDRMFERHVAEAEARSLTYSRLLFEILNAHQTGTRLEAPQARAANAAVLRELCRIGNNLNQIARQAHLMRLHLIQQKAETALDELVAAVRRM